MSRKLSALTDEELEQVTGGGASCDCTFGRIIPPDGIHYINP